MTEDELIAFIGGLDGVEVVVAGPDRGAPEATWGDVFFSLKLGIGRESLRERFPDGAEHDPAALDRLFSHPVYAGHGWVSVLNPDTTSDEVRALILAAHAR